MGNKQIAFTVILELDQKWANDLNPEEIVEHIKERLNSSLGFTGQVKKFSVVSGGARKR
jgi:hypothetical protein